MDDQRKSRKSRIVYFFYPFINKKRNFELYLFKNRGRQEILTIFLINKAALGITFVKSKRVQKPHYGPSSFSFFSTLDWSSSIILNIVAFKYFIRWEVTSLMYWACSGMFLSTTPSWFHFTLRRTTCFSVSWLWKINYTIFLNDYLLPF